LFTGDLYYSDDCSFVYDTEMLGYSIVPAVLLLVVVDSSRFVSVGIPYLFPPAYPYARQQIRGSKEQFAITVLVIWV